MFREAFAKRRYLVSATVYYEWRDDPDGKTPFAVARVDGEPVAFGGVWEIWKSPERERLQTFATITTEAKELLATIQDRMPVIIEKADWPLWLGEVEGDPATLLPGARGRPAVLACREGRRQRPQRWPSAARANSRRGTDAALVLQNSFQHPCGYRCTIACR
jgi:putative SOS response-associated peptidase YedK